MRINYFFKDECFEYHVSHDRYLVALHNLLLKEDKEKLIQMLIDADDCILNLADEYKDELKAYFETNAYKAYLDRRYA